MSSTPLTPIQNTPLPRVGDEVIVILGDTYKREVKTFLSTIYALEHTQSGLSFKVVIDRDVYGPAGVVLPSAALDGVVTISISPLPELNTGHPLRYTTEHCASLLALNVPYFHFIERVTLMQNHVDNASALNVTPQSKSEAA